MVRLSEYSVARIVLLYDKRIYMTFNCCSIGSVTSDSELSDNGEVRTTFKINTINTFFVVSTG